MQLTMNRKLWVSLHHVSNSWVFLVLNGSSVKVNIQAMQVMGCIMEEGNAIPT